MADNHTDKTIVYESRPENRSGGNGALWFIVGGLVVAVLAILLLFGGLDLGGGTAGGSDGGTVAIDSDVNIGQPAGGEAAPAEGTGD